MSQSAAMRRVGQPTNVNALGIYGRSERELSVGIIRAQPSWLQSNRIPQKREFILICEGRDNRAKNRRADDDEKGANPSAFQGVYWTINSVKFYQ